MNFLYPGFLFALLSVAIPVVIHLFNFRKFKKVYFSNVQLLKVVEQQHSSKEKLKNLLILLMRILAITFLVLAFAQPYIPQNNNKASSLNNAVSIYIDNSYSMEAINKDGNLLDEAKRRARELVKGFGLNDRFQLLTNDFEGKHQRLLSEEEFLKALDDVKISSTARNLQQILNRQANVLTGSVNKYSFLISDFQKNISTEKKLVSKPDIQYSFLKLNATALPNVAVDSVWMLSATHQPNSTEKLVVQLKNYSEEKAVNIPVKLTINNQQKGLSTVTIPAGKIIRDTLTFSRINVGWQKGVLSIKDFPVTFDDSLNFSFQVDKEMPVLSINGLGGNSYVRALFATDNYFKLTENSESNIQYADFSKYGLIVLNGLKNPSSGLAQQLKTYLNAGGTIVLFPNLDADVHVYNTFLTAMALPAIQNLNTIASKVDKIDLQHPIFRTVFEQVPKNLELPSATRFFTFRESNKLNKEWIMQLPGPNLFFAKFGTANGQMYLSAVGLDPRDGNLVRSPIFVSLMYRMALNTGKESALYSILGNDNLLESNKILLGKNQTLKLSATNFQVIPEMRQADGRTLIYIADQVKMPGFYNLMLADSLRSIYAFNTSRQESDMHYLSKADLSNLSGENNFKTFDSDKDAVKLIASKNKIEQTLWKLCLILSLIFIAIEILLIRFFNNSKKTI